MKQIIIAIFSVLVVFFLTAQSCNFGGISSGLAADCLNGDPIVCDDTEAYQCHEATYGVGYSVSKAPAFDVSACCAEESEEAGEEAFDSETIARRLITISSDLEDVIEDLEDIKREADE